MSFLKSCAVILFIVLVQACSNNNATSTSTADAPATAQPAPAATTQASTTELPSYAVLDASGNKVDLQTFKGKKLFVNLWATWCPPCRAEMPSINKLYEASNKAGAQFIMLSLDNDFETAKAYVKKNDLKVPVYYPGSDLPPLFSVNGIPTTFIFDEGGKLIAQHDGSQDYNTDEFRKLFGATN